jgi:hypothetical protein
MLIFSTVRACMDCLQGHAGAKTRRARARPGTGPARCRGGPAAPRAGAGLRAGAAQIAHAVETAAGSRAHAARAVRAGLAPTGPRRATPGSAPIARTDSPSPPHHHHHFSKCARPPRRPVTFRLVLARIVLLLFFFSKLSRTGICGCGCARVCLLFCVSCVQYGFYGSYPGGGWGGRGGPGSYGYGMGGGMDGATELLPPFFLPPADPTASAPFAAPLLPVTAPLAPSDDWSPLGRNGHPIGDMMGRQRAWHRGLPHHGAAEELASEAPRLLLDDGSAAASPPGMASMGPSKSPLTLVRATFP